MKNNREELAQEAARLHEILFAKPIPEQIKNDYVRAHDFYLTDLKEKGASLPPSILSLDLEAVEFALRRQNKLNSLSRKFHIISYLAEVRSPYFPYYVNLRDQPVYGFYTAIKLTLRSIYKYLKGSYLIWRHRVA